MLACQFNRDSTSRAMYYVGVLCRAGLVLGYAAVPAKESRAAVRRLVAALGGMR